MMLWSGIRKSALLISLLCVGALANAQDTSDALERLLQDVRDQAEASEAENRQREKEFGDERDERQAILESTRAKLQREMERSVRLKAQFDNNELLLEELSDTLRIRTGDMGELFGIFRQMAAETRGNVDASLISVQHPQRKEEVARLAESSELPAIADLRKLQLLLLEEMVGSGEVVRFETAVNDASGLTALAVVARVGVFNVVSEDGYLHVDNSSSVPSVLPRQPARRYASGARDYFATTSGTSRLAIDPSRGTLLSLVIQSPGLLEQATYGGAIGYTILMMGVAGIAIALTRFVSLHKIRSSVARQLQSNAISTDNPLGRVLSVYDENNRMAVDVLEKKLDEAILKETPRLEKFQGIIKVIAGVAPLMGLLGTVVGMIRTFQSITLFGTGDPQLMADGISQALVTTVEGLVVAIPLVFLHTLISNKSRELIDILEEQSAGIIARHADRPVRG
jgi:biopolymer transport protein ExbB